MAIYGEKRKEKSFIILISKLNLNDIFIKIKEYRNKELITQEELAKKLGVSFASINKSKIMAGTQY